MPAQRQAEATPFFERLCAGMTTMLYAVLVTFLDVPTKL
jgi:hypothetical protein